jgi:hypothetical protein
VIPGRNSTAHSLSNQQAHRGRNDERNLASVATTRPAAAVSAIRTTRIQRANHTSAASMTSRTEHSQARHRPMTSSAPTFCQPLQQHSFNAPSPAATSTAAAAAAAAAPPLEPFRNPVSINISPQQREHQRQPEKQQQRTCITIEQLLQPASSTSNTATETRRLRRPILTATLPLRQRQETSNITSQIQQKGTNVNLPNIVTDDDALRKTTTTTTTPYYIKPTSDISSRQRCGIISDENDDRNNDGNDDNGGDRKLQQDRRQA